MPVGGMYGLDQAGLFPDLSGLFQVESKDEVIAKLKAENPDLSGVELSQAVMMYDMETYGGIRIGDIIVDPNFVGSLARNSGKAAVNLTLKTLDRIAAEIKQPEVARQTIEQYLNRPGVGKEERNIIQNVLETIKSKTGNAKIKVGEFIDEVKTNLLPLKSERISNKTPDIDLENMSDSDFRNLASGHATRYEGVNLPSELKVPTKNYTENVYNSPILTNAGRKHFNLDVAPNYFAHTRTEDLVGNLKDSAGNILGSDVKTRRILEVQSDLFQKGRLDTDEKLFANVAWPNQTREEVINYWKKAMSEDSERFKDLLKHYDDTRIEFAPQIKAKSQLESYENTWHERVIREETRKAAEDGQSKIQIPTGETAMKIERLGDDRQWRLSRSTTRLIPETLKVGLEVNHGMTPNALDKWIITDVLGDGKFKAVPKRTKDQTSTELARSQFSDGWKTFDNKVFSNKEEASAYIEQYLKDASETFDISGKVDENNPIYQFYESKIDKFVKKEYGAQLVTDAKGVTWWEYDVPKDAGKNPVQALGVGLFGIGEFKDKIFGTKTLTSEDDNATYETKIPGLIRSLRGDQMEVTMTEKEKYHPLTPAEEPKFTPTDLTDTIVQGIAFNETREKETPYTFQQFSGDEKMGDAIGKYQITEAELASYGEKFLGFKVKPGWFLNEPEWQDAYIRNKVAFLESEGLDIPEILALHRAGISGWGDPVRVRAKVLERGAYIQSALDYMKTIGQMSN